MPPRRTQADRERYWKARNDLGLSKKAAAAHIGISPNTATAWEKGLKDTSGKSYHEKQKASKLRPPLRRNELTREARQALDDFEYFRRRFFGRISSPWQVDAAYKFVEALKSPHKDFIVLNCPPGAGKSTLLHDIEAWLTCRNRTIRGILGSSVQPMAVKYTQRLRRSFERIVPVEGDPDEVAAGRALDAISTLSKDYGRFQTDMQDTWTQQAFIVAQVGDVLIDEKEPTWQAFGLDATYLGTRVNIAVWDDVVTNKTMRTLEAIEKQREDWDNEAETRLEPMGSLFLVGQRLGPNDLYRYCLDKIDSYDDEDDDDEPYVGQTIIDAEGSQVVRKYSRIIYPAHNETACDGIHKKAEAKAWPDGCLLDPWRLTWKELKGIQNRDNGKYRTVYQQEDMAAEDVLVPMHYITGGNVGGEEFPGCYDTDRSIMQLPKGIDLNECMSIVTVDPSPTKFWSVQMWLYHQPSERRFLMDLERLKMDFDDFFDYNPDTREYTGMLEDMWQAAYRLGMPFRYLIIERNAAQRFMAQQSTFRQWCTLRGVSFFPHDTTSNKSDPEYGVQILATHYRHGRYNLPNPATHQDLSFVKTKKLIDEVTVWPHGTTDDCVMAQWFLEWWLPRLTLPNVIDIPSRPRPSWVGHSNFRVPASQRLEIRRKYPNGLYLPPESELPVEQNQES